MKSRTCFIEHNNNKKDDYKNGIIVVDYHFDKIFNGENVSCNQISVFTYSCMICYLTADDFSLPHTH